MKAEVTLLEGEITPIGAEIWLCFALSYSSLRKAEAPRRGLVLTDSIFKSSAGREAEWLCS